MSNYIIFLQGAESSTGSGVFSSKLSQTYQHWLQTDVSAFSSLFKLTNQCAHHCCNYGENQNQPSSSSVRLSQPNHHLLPRLLSFNASIACQQDCCCFFSPIRPNPLAIPRVVPLDRLSSCLLHLSPPDLHAGWRVCTMQLNARDETSNHRGSTLLCSRQWGEIWR